MNERTATNKLKAQYEEIKAARVTLHTAEQSLEAIFLQEPSRYSQHVPLFEKQAELAGELLDGILKELNRQRKASN